MTHGSLRIFVVDDDQSMAKTLADIFRIKGHQTEVAHSGPEALEKIEQQSFDCVLSDIKMPGINGVELFRAIRALQPDLPIVLMTAYTEDCLVQQGLAEGALAALTKPLNIDTLLTFFLPWEENNRSSSSTTTRPSAARSEICCRLKALLSPTSVTPMPCWSESRQTTGCCFST